MLSCVDFGCHKLVKSWLVKSPLEAVALSQRDGAKMFCHKGFEKTLSSLWLMVKSVYMDRLQSGLEVSCNPCLSGAPAGGKVVRGPIPQDYCVFVWDGQLVKMSQESCSSLGKRAGHVPGSVLTLDVAQLLRLGLERRMYKYVVNRHVANSIIYPYKHMRTYANFRELSKTQSSQDVT